VSNNLDEVDALRRKPTVGLTTPTGAGQGLRSPYTRSLALNEAEDFRSTKRYSVPVVQFFVRTTRPYPFLVDFVLLVMAMAVSGLDSYLISPRRTGGLPLA
jgi:hypothetical protein